MVETTHVRATFSTRGAVLKNWVLKHYLEANGQPIDIIPAQPAAVASKPFARVGAVGRPDSRSGSSRRCTSRTPTRCSLARRPARSRSGTKTRAAWRSPRPSTSSLKANHTAPASPSTPRSAARRSSRPFTAAPASAISNAASKADEHVRVHELSVAAGDRAAGPRRAAHRVREHQPRVPSTKDSSTTPASTITTSSARCCRPMA